MLYDQVWGDEPAPRFQSGSSKSRNIESSDHLEMFTSK